MAKSKMKKADYIEQLKQVVHRKAYKLTVKQIRKLIAKHND